MSSGPELEPLSTWTRILSAAISAGIVAGTVDIFMATLVFGAPPTAILRAIAAGLIGKASYQGGAASATLGVGLQWLISIGAAGVYILVGKRFSLLLRRPLLIGPVFGAGVFTFMRAVVLPLSQSTVKLPGMPLLAEDFAANMLFGMIIAIIVSRMSRREVPNVAHSSVGATSGGV
jgi:hypothetical protein